MLQIDFERFVEGVPPEWVRGRRGVQGPTWNDLRVLLALLDARTPARCLEVGIHQGHTASLLLERGACIKRYVGIDRVSPNAPEGAGGIVADDPRVTLLVCGGGTRTIPPGQVAFLGPFDWVFIDADHSRAGVEHDSEYAVPLLVSGGVVIWHDYGVPSQYRPGGPLFGVKDYLDGAGMPLHHFPDPTNTSSIAWAYKEG